MTTRLTDEELSSLEQMEREATARSTRYWICSPRPDGTARNTVVRLIAEVRELRAETAYSRLSAADRELVLALPALIRESADTVRADERAKVEREIVEWLRREPAGTTWDDGLAKAIERGEHRR